MSFKKNFICIIIFMLLMAVRADCDASPPKRMVNILTWYNYLKSPRIASVVKDQCGVEISYDEYYSSNDCLERISTIRDFYDYDIIIFPSDIYEFIKKKIERKNSDLSQVVKDYGMLAKNHYLSHGYPDNVVYFTLSLSGFVWNSTIVKLSANDSISSVFEKAKNNIVIVINSPIEVWNLINNSQKLSRDMFVSAFEKTIQDADVYITNEYSKLYDKDSFAFAFQRSSDAIFAMKASKNKALKFFVHPGFSYISFDMMAELNADPETRCVAKALASKKILDIVQKETYCLSPYETYKMIDDSIFQSAYKQLFNNAYNARWIDLFSIKNAKEYNKLRAMWSEIHMLPQVMKNHMLVLKRK